MTRLLGALAALVALATVPACAAPLEDEGEESGDSAYTADDAACHDARPGAGESATDARARCLTAYATRLVDAQVARREDPRDAALAAFRDRIRVAGETGCFTEDVSGGGLGAWQYDIDSKRDVGMLGLQIRASIEFLKHFHRDLDGYPNHFFDTLEICPHGQIGGDLALTGSRLRVGVRTGLWGRYGVQTSPVLRERWTRGEHLAGNPALEKLGGVRWAVLDPAGTPRTTLRRALRRLVAELRGDLDGLAGRPEADVRRELTRLVREQASESAQDERGRSIRDRALARVAEMSAAELGRLAQDWKLALEDGDTTEGSEEGTVVMQDVLSKRDVQVRVNQIGLVNVNNFKQISVDTELFFPRAQSFSRYVDVEKSETTVEVNQYGVVNVQLNDVVTVRLQVLYGRTAQTASLDRALGP